MAIVLNPPPVDQPMFDNKGNMTESWRRFFMDIQTLLINLNGSAGPLPVNFNTSAPLPTLFQTGVGHTVDDLTGVLQTQGLLRQA